MATKFQADITQPMQPSAADPSALSRQEQLKASMFGTVGSLVTQGFELYKDASLASIEEQAAALPREALERARAASDAKQQLVKVEQGMQQELSFVGPPTTEEDAAMRSRIGGYVEQAERLKRAAEGGMSPSEYTMRVQSLTRTALAKFPGLSREIRQMIGAATGMPYADDTAAMWYVRSMFEQKPEPKEGSPEFVKNEIETIAKYNGMSPVDINSLRTANPAEYQLLKNKAFDVVSVRQATENAKVQIDALYQQGGESAGKAVQLLANSAGARAAVDMAKWQAANAGVMDRIAQSVAKGELGVAGRNEAELQILQGQATAIISKSYREAESDLLNRLTAGTMDQATYDAQKKIIAEHKARALGMFDGNNLLGTATVLSKFRDKTITEQTKQMEVLTSAFGVFGDAKVAQRFFGTTPDSRERRNIKDQSPELYNLLTAYEESYKGAFGTANNLLGAAPMLEVGKVLRDAVATPNATPPIAMSPGVTPNVAKAALQAVKEEGQSVWDKLRKDPNTTLKTPEINTLSTMLNNGVEYNQPIMAIRQGVADEAALFLKLPEMERSKVKASVSATLEDNSRKVVRRTKDIETTFGAKLEIGVRSDGTIGIIPPMHLLRSTLLTPTYAARSSELFGMFNKYEVMKGRDVIPGKEEELKAYVRAAEEWEKMEANRVNNMVLSRAITNNEDTRNVGKDIASRLNSGQPLPSFFSMAPAAVALPEVTGGSRPMPTIGPVRTEKAALSAMQVGLQDLADHIEQLERSLKDAIPGSDLHKRLSSDIAMAKKELARGGQ